MKRRCVACNGTGYYDAYDKKGNLIPCSACGGTGIEQPKSRELIRRLYEIINVFCLNDCLEVEFEAAEEQEDLNTINDLVEYFEEELRYWSDN